MLERRMCFERGTIIHRLSCFVSVFSFFGALCFVAPPGWIYPQGMDSLYNLSYRGDSIHKVIFFVNILLLPEILQLFGQGLSELRSWRILYETIHSLTKLKSSLFACHNYYQTLDYFTCLQLLQGATLCFAAPGAGCILLVCFSEYIVLMISFLPKFCKGVFLVRT